MLCAAAGNVRAGFLAVPAPLNASLANATGDASVYSAAAYNERQTMSDVEVGQAWEMYSASEGRWVRVVITKIDGDMDAQV